MPEMLKGLTSKITLFEEACRGHLWPVNALATTIVMDQMLHCPHRPQGAT